MPSRTAPNTTTVGGRQIDVAPLEIINYARLAAREPAEVERLLGACRSPGFFYLDLRKDSILADLWELYAAAERYFDQPQEVKVRGHEGGEDRRYKAGEHGEGFEIARDELFQERLALPSLLADHAELLKRFSTGCDAATQTMLSCLSDALGLDEGDRFENSHRVGEPSDSGLLLFSGPCKSNRADVVDNKHTDTGSLTLLFCDEWSAELEMPETKQWAFVEPKPGHALVNVADTLQSLSGNRLYSCPHRVTQPVDGFKRRHFVLFYLRGEKGGSDRA